MYVFTIIKTPFILQEELLQVIYRLTFNLNPVCKEILISCPTEACTINLKQDEFGNIKVQDDSVQCTYLYPQSSQDNAVPEPNKEINYENHEFIENLNKQIIQNETATTDHEIKSARDENDPQIIAMRTSDPNYCPGCPYDLNPHLPGFVAFNRKIEKQMDEILPNNFKHKVIDIIKATRAVPPSSNIIQYQLLVEVGESSCLKNVLTDSSDCTLQSNVPIKTCLVTFEDQPWKHDSRKITKNNCTTVSINNNEFNIAQNLINESYIIAKDNWQQKDNAFDGLKSVLTEDFTRASNLYTQENEKPLATEHPFTKLFINKSNDEEEPQSFTDKIQEFKEFIKDFDLPIKTNDNDNTQQELINDKEIVLEKVSVHNKDEKFNSPNNIINSNLSFNKKKRYYSPDVHDISTRKKRALSGAPFEKEVDDPEIIEYANIGIAKLSQYVESTHEPILVEITEASTQVLSGILYRIKAKVGVSDCRKERKVNANECPKKVKQDCNLKEGSFIKDCLFNIWSQPWVDKGCPNAEISCVRDPRSKRSLVDTTNLSFNKKEISYSPALHDIDTRRKRTLVGAPSNKNVNDPEIIEYANLGITKLSQNLESTNEPILVEIIEASSQVVSGISYKIKVKVGVSDCPKGTKVNCQLKEGSDIKECLFSIWSQPWVDKGSPDIKINCDHDARSKRSLKGATYIQNMLIQAGNIRHERMFQDFIVHFNKKYSSNKEKQYRFKIFKKNLLTIEKLQAYEQGTGEYGVTMFADLTSEEFKKQYLGLRPDLRAENQIPILQAKIPNIELPVEFDWRHYNVVTPVKNQGQCGSCWAFSVTGNVEGLYAIKHGKLLSLSEQELVDCDKLDEACNGGLPDNAYRAIENLGGLELESDYPYIGRDEKCYFNRQKIKVEVISAVNITSNETKMAQWLIGNGPISIGINANAMQFYIGGISHPFKFLCNPDNLDHGVLIVGYGIHSKYYFCLCNFL